jgi:hypothetical protein
MTDTLSDLFAEARSSVVEWDGGHAYAVYELVDVPEQLIVEFGDAKASPVQGLRLKIRGGSLLVNGMKTDDLLLWRETAPDRVIVRVERRGSARVSLKAWNVWRGGSDVVQAWLGNAGMRVESGDDGRHVELRCSDGVGPVAFDDLQVRLNLG